MPPRQSCPSPLMASERATSDRFGPARRTTDTSASDDEIAHGGCVARRAAYLDITGLHTEGVRHDRRTVVVSVQLSKGVLLKNRWMDVYEQAESSGTLLVSLC